ncbi:hypothetical protein SSPO_010380 [Streptomyces antimycoticus]|uniref:Uncharacterized protein n=1 Tax=Streptomyces antimycoticus TaxID=68175 RepID=A0A499UEI2_9ACTN|nr:hypothetical protein SSPO_010380 [Streptomyces antimycoticus]
MLRTAYPRDRRQTLIGGWGCPAALEGRATKEIGAQAVFVMERQPPPDIAFIFPPQADPGPGE